MSLARMNQWSISKSQEIHSDFILRNISLRQGKYLSVMNCNYKRKTFEFIPGKRMAFRKLKYYRYSWHLLQWSSPLVLFLSLIPSLLFQNVVFSKMLGKWNYAVCNLLELAFFSQHTSLESHLSCFMYQWLVPLLLSSIPW